MNRVFADTYYFFALLNRNDEAHDRAVEFSNAVDELVTTEWVLTELADGLANSRRRDMFSKTRREMLADEYVDVVPLDMGIYEKGIQLYENRGDKEWSLTDCISFVVMARESITDALTGDHHFEQAGFVALLK
jgi:predicted nucleic acid-binding protein